MTRLAWDTTGDRTFEAGVDRGVLYIPDETGAYTYGVAWNGLTSVTEAPAGAAATAQYADNIKYLNLISAETFAGTIQAFTYPDEFAQFDGLASPTPGVAIGQQSRKSFGFCYRTKFGNDVDGNEHGYKLHLVYGATAAPSQKDYATINDSPAAIDFSWAIDTVPVGVSGLKPTSLIVIDSTKVDSGQLTAFETVLYGTDGVDPEMPLPDDVVAAFTGGLTVVTTVTAPTYNSGTHVITIPGTTGINYYDGATLLTSGDLAALTSGQTKLIKARPQTGYYFATGNVDEWEFSY